MAAYVPWTKLQKPAWPQNRLARFRVSRVYFLTSLAFIRALIALALISNSRSASCCADGAAAGTGSDAGATSIATGSASSLVGLVKARISLTLLSMSRWSSSFGSSDWRSGPGGGAVDEGGVSMGAGTSSSWSLGSLWPSMSLSFMSALMLRTSLSSPDKPVHACLQRVKFSSSGAQTSVHFVSNFYI